MFMEDIININSFYIIVVKVNNEFCIISKIF